MNPLAIKALAGTVILALSFGAGWTANGWRLKTDIAELKTDQAESISQASQAALEDYKEAAKVIKDAAGGAQVDITTLGVKLDALNRRIKNAPPPPLPAGCAPGPQRLRDLTEAAAATDQTTARTVPSR